MLLAPRLRLPAVLPLWVSVPTVLLAPMIIVPPGSIRAVPVPLNPVVAFIKPPAASRVPLLTIVPASVVLEPVWPVKVAPDEIVTDRKVPVLLGFVWIVPAP